MRTMEAYSATKIGENHASLGYKPSSCKVCGKLFGELQILQMPILDLYWKEATFSCVDHLKLHIG